MSRRKISGGIYGLTRKLLTAQEEKSIVRILDIYSKQFELIISQTSQIELPVFSRVNYVDMQATLHCHVFDQSDLFNSLLLLD